MFRTIGFWVTGLVVFSCAFVSPLHAAINLVEVAAFPGGSDDVSYSAGSNAFIACERANLIISVWFESDLPGAEIVLDHQTTNIDSMFGPANYVIILFHPNQPDLSVLQVVVQFEMPADIDDGQLPLTIGVSDQPSGTDTAVFTADLLSPVPLVSVTPSQLAEGVDGEVQLLSEPNSQLYSLANGAWSQPSGSVAAIDDTASNSTTAKFSGTQAFGSATFQFSSDLVAIDGLQLPQRCNAARSASTVFTAPPTPPTTWPSLVSGGISVINPLLADPATSPDQANKLQRALNNLDSSLNKYNRGKTVAGLHDLRRAVGALEDAIKRGLAPSSVDATIDEIVAFVRQYASDEIDAAIARGGSANRISKAQTKLAQGDAETDRAVACARFVTAFVKAKQA